MPAKPTRRNMTLLRQTCNLIPAFMVSKLAKEHGIDSRGYSPWSHAVSQIYGQMTRAVGLNDICDSLDINSSALRAIRGATPPKRNTFSNANRTRNPEMAENLYWQMHTHLTGLQPSFAKGKHRNGYLRRFNSAIKAVDSTTIQLVANCMDWASHRRRKAAAKCHMRLDLRSMLPEFAIVDTAKIADAKKAREVCASLNKGEITVFDKAYNDFGHLFDLDTRGVFWVARAKKKMDCKVVGQLESTNHKSILKDERIELTGKLTKGKYPAVLRRVEALVEVRGEMKLMVFITNNLKWSAWSVAELYRSRWGIETFFKELKETVQLVDFIGYNKNAVCWQVWMALLTHLLMRFLAHMSQWGHSFTRLFSLVRAALWHRYELIGFLKSYGTADCSYRVASQPEALYLPGFGSPQEYPVGQPKRRRSNIRKRYEKSLQAGIAK